MTSTSELNRAIEEQNEYIFKLNKNIRKKMKKLEEEKDLSVNSNNFVPKKLF